MVIEKRLESFVHFTGRVPHDEVARYYDLIDIFVYPRLIMRLTDLVTPLKPLEAMAMGHIVLASDVGGHKELITDGENGILFPAGDVVALVERIIELMNNKTTWNRLRDSGRKYVEKVRNWKTSVGYYTSVYNSLV